MKLIVGLGNPGKDYEKTRHNAGFMCIDEVAKKLNFSFDTKKFKALIAMGFVGGEKVILMKPQTYMNLSGEAVGECARFYNVDLEDEVEEITANIMMEYGDEILQLTNTTFDKLK